MATRTIRSQLEKLDQLKRYFGADAEAKMLDALTRIDLRRFKTAEELARYHETLLFVRAHPAGRKVLQSADRALSEVSAIRQRLERSAADLSPLDDAEMSGIHGTSVNAAFTYPFATWLARDHANEIEIDWEGYEDEARLGQSLPRLLPLLEDETLVEAHFPYLEWLKAAAGDPARALPWLIERFSAMKRSYPEQAEIYDSLRLYVRWTPTRYRSSRTGMRFPRGKTFYHHGSMLARRDVSLAAELGGPPLPNTRLSEADGVRLLELIRQTSAQRYRELHGFSYGDPAGFIRFDAGRGIDIYVNEVLPERRLPLRAYHSGFMVKNGVPVGYVEGLSLFDRMEIGFNIYYTFREGESAYLYAKVMKVFHQLLGVNCFSVDPYQIGHENQEGLASGAFWFYRKLGFVPARPDLLKLVRQEEKKIAARANYRTPTEVLAKIAEGHVYFDHVAGSSRDWSRFHVRNLGLAANGRMKKDFRGHVSEFRAAAETRVAAALGIRTRRWPELDQRSFSNWAPVLYLIKDLAKWTGGEKKLLVRAIRAKGSETEGDYLRLMQRHSRLRDSVISIAEGRK